MPTQIYAKLHMDALAGACFVGVFWHERIVQPFIDGVKYAASDVMTMMAEKEGQIIDVSPAFKRLFFSEYDGSKIVRAINEVGWTSKHLPIDQPGETVA